MFDDIVHFTALFSSSWPGVTISDDPASSGNTAASWNYGAMTTNEFGGMGDGSAPTAHDGGVGAYGTMGVEDAGYDAITLCPGTAGAVCSG
mmetsp:Transcript_57130/g.116923  ORF Transcript_57130/g.116923 Transcript_57130/m.116923 type:complete len:91 (-) Transcript_57130:266-538(-)|eukprot:CAMPEP_0181319306 /NCGR_PEP_ID=MMETSP1101-20121128/17495_1 /TAXON_ID=46948 /ORGANISM="Rhodomonas abbreviata, Strain Caron Lab Isolate" /LENGTH=90 /DNA_ID=CAMNT_0023426885 /DNA_START=30 /DNA_END=302 /DNA_ORIENTATION=+